MNSHHFVFGLIIFNLVSLSAWAEPAKNITDIVQPVQAIEPEDAAMNDPIWHNRHAEGWFWRDIDPEVIEMDDVEAEKIKPASIDPNRLYPSMTEPLTNPLEVLKAIQKAVETSKAKAVLQPSSENILNFIRVQDEVLKKSSLLADNWQRLIWRNPELDYNQVRPSNPVALASYTEQYRTDLRTAMREIAQDYGLYFVIAESCPYCHEMAPYLKRFADLYGFTVITVSIDGGTVAEFPNAMYSPEFAEQLGVKITPAIILAKPNEGIIETISYGFISLDELEKRIYRLFRLEPGKPNYRLPTTTTLSYQP